MSDTKQPEQMRPIPDGGLKDGMPSWLKRPPAWRDLPTAEQRRERALPEPDISEIDPHTLVDVNDLPLWLQAIAARGDLPVPAPDSAVEHAVEVVQSASQPPVVGAAPEIAAGVSLHPGEEPIAAVPAEPPVVIATTPPAAGDSVRIHLPVWAAILIVVLMIALAFVLVTLM